MQHDLWTELCHYAELTPSGRKYLFRINVGLQFFYLNQRQFWLRTGTNGQLGLLLLFLRPLDNLGLFRWVFDDAILVSAH